MEEIFTTELDKYGGETRWPFMFVLDNQANRTGWMVLHAPIQSQSRIDMYTRYRHQGYRFLGMTSFMDYPRLGDADHLDYSTICEGWAHCFRESGQYLPEGQPRALLPFSDFIDPLLVSKHKYTPASVGYDFLYLGADAPWKMRAKNWPLAKKCLPILCEKLGLRGVAVGVDPDAVPSCRNLVVRPWLDYAEFLSVLGACRFLFLPNIFDASPRVLVEALCLNVPVVANQRILGGWHYINTKSGVFFEDEEDIEYAVERCLSQQFQPRAFFINRFGPRRSGLKLRTLIKSLQADFDARGPLRLRY